MNIYTTHARSRRGMAVAVLAALLSATGLMPSCSKEHFADEREVVLDFSADTVSFDTVFTTMGSTTRQLRVYNRTSSDVRLGSVTLGKGRASRFRLNVDGDTALVARDVEVPSGDSIYIFIQANINPNNASSPILEEDAILFSNGQRLPLTAWGRDAYYHKVPDSGWYSVIDCAAWRHDKPHVILGTAAVLDGNTLALQAGDELYFGNDAMLIIDSNATLLVQGTAERPVLFTSVRHDGWYSFLPGQWSAVWFYPGSVGNVVDHAVFEKGSLGLVVDTNVGPDPTLAISNTVIHHMSNTGILGRGARIEGRNLLLYQCGVATFWARYGGDYSFDHCTFAGYWAYGGRSNPGVVLNNWYTAAGGAVVPRDLRRADFTDCILYGTWSQGEVLLDANEAAQFNYSFTHCLVRGGAWDEDPQFEDPDNDDYHLQDGSPAAGIGYDYGN